MCRLESKTFNYKFDTAAYGHFLLRQFSFYETALCLDWHLFCPQGGCLMHGQAFWGLQLSYLTENPKQTQNPQTLAVHHTLPPVHQL